MQSQSHANTQQDTPQLTESLLEDLLNPAMSPTLICQIHGLTLTQLHALTQSADYQAAIEAIQSINAARTPTIESTLHLQSLATLQEAADLTHQLALTQPASPTPVGEVSRSDGGGSSTLRPSPTLHFGGAGEVSRNDGRGSSTLRSSPVPTGEVSAQRTEGVFNFPPLPQGEGRGEGSSSLHLRTLESLRKSATTLLRETRPTPSRRPRKPTTNKGCHGLSSSQAVSSSPINKPPPPPNQLWHAVCVKSPAGIWCPRRDTDTPTTEARHELRDSDLSIRSTHLHPPSGRTDREPRKPWNRRV